MPIMGIIRNPKSPPANNTNVANALFSGTQQRVLALLFGQPDRSFYANELIGLAAAGSGAVQRELGRLAESGLITSRAVGNQRHYQANAASPIYAELRGIVQKTVGLAEPLREALAPLARKIRAAFVYGSVAKKTDTAGSDIDLFLLSDDIGYAEMFSAIEAATRNLGRTVNPTIFTRKELAKRVNEKGSFLTRVLAQPKIWIIGGESDLAV